MRKMPGDILPWPRSRGAKFRLLSLYFKHDSRCIVSKIGEECIGISWSRETVKSEWRRLLLVQRVDLGKCEGNFEGLASKGVIS